MTVPPPMSEAELAQALRELFHLTGWETCYHTHDSRRSNPGFPDWIALKGNRMLAIELKTDKGKATAAQMIWLDAFSRIPGCEAWLWRPADLRSGEITRVLQGKEH